ncbi:uncharacterized protein TOT_020000212 [Theileria orientalis strain Shintoku]|uniref:Importin N-terminal domain-containing protein n=1 Tax=Theileria orientalis strain Shintoku TaxID=869250 RepID=J4C373_THEOR|nr:uncharacterized protein TOT_020000212 [Theileria orientalis strain Shintoku]BAM39941.1 uncharacterized protein TOT_020000212 [Theileria orientalis strain Shintoku]|eukprot:XP_009690242.1 uncharacterized protein TOT_020000212 [Theileria orientalis strain Shintoku]
MFFDLPYANINFYRSRSYVRKMNTIDVNNYQLLVQALEGSLSPDDAHRKRCEEYLINFSLKEGSIPSFMRIMSNFQFEDAVRLASSIRLKNHIISHWIDSTPDYSIENPIISHTDRAFLLDNLYLCLVSSNQRTIRNQCYQILRHIMFNLEIKDVKTMLTSISADLGQRENSDRISCALSSLRKVVTKYEYHGSSLTNELNDIISAYFGPLLSVALDASKIGLGNDEAATLIHLVLKIYFSLALLTSPSTDLLKESIHHWMNLVLFVLDEFVKWQQSWPQRADVQVSIFAELKNDDEDHLCKLEQFKCFKWSLRILNKFISRHSSYKDNPTKFMFFSSFISDKYSRKPWIELHYLSICDYNGWQKCKRNSLINSDQFVVSMINLLKLESENKLLFNNLSHHLIWSYLRNCLSVESHFNNCLKDHLSELLGVYCLNTFKYTKEDLEQYQEEPEQFIKLQSELSFQFCSNRGTCSDFLKDLVKTYPSETIKQIKRILQLGFESTDNTVLYSAMSIVGYVAEKLIRRNRTHQPAANHKEKARKKFGLELQQVDGEELLEVKVLGLLNSPDIWIRMRAAWLSGRIVKRVHNIRNFETLRKLYVRLLDMMVDGEILVAVFASNALIELFRIENKNLNPLILGSLSSLLERLFMLMNRIYLESVTSVLAEIVETYPQEVVPYAKDIILNMSNNLTKSLMASKEGVAEAADDEKILVRWTMMQTLNTVLRLLTHSTQDTNKEGNQAPKEPAEEKLLLELSSYGVIITTIVNLLKLLFGTEDEMCVEYLDEGALLLANLVRLLDVKPVKNLIAAKAATAFADFWMLLVMLLDLMRKLSFEMVSDFGMIREPLVALAHRDPQGFAKILDQLYRICLEARNSGLGDEVDDVIADCLEVSLESGAVHAIFATILDDASTRVAALVSNCPKTSMQDLASDNVHLMRLSSLVIMYYYRNLHASFAEQAAAANQAVANHLKVLSSFVVKYSVYCTWKSIRKYSILACCTLLKNNATKLDDTANALITLMQAPKDDLSDDKYSGSECDYDDEDDDDYDYDDNDSEWSEYEITESPLNHVCEMKVAKQLLMDLRDSLNQNTRNNMVFVLNST